MAAEKQLKGVGFTVNVLKEVGFSATTLEDTGFSAMDLRDGMKVIENGVNKLEKELSCPVW